MENIVQIVNIAEIIGTEVARFPGEERLANALRCAATFVHDDYPDATSGDFGRAAELCGLHKQAAMNRWNEAKKAMGDQW